MLTKQDFSQIKKIVEQSVNSIKVDVSGLKKDVSGLKTDVSGLKKDMTDVKKDITKIRKDIDVIISVFDRDYLDLRRRIDRIETHLQLKPLADF